MKMLATLKQNWRDSLYIDKVLYPSMVKRVGLYGLFFAGLVLLSFGAWMGRDLVMGIPVAQVVGFMLGGLYLIIVALVLLVCKAYDYIKKEI